MTESAMDLLPTETLEEAAECLKVLGHPVRLRIVDILMHGEYPVNAVAELCRVQPHQVSEHMRMLQGRRLLSSRRDGRIVYYAIADPRLPALLGCIRRCALPEPDGGDGK